MNWIDWLVDKFADALEKDLGKQFGYVHEHSWKEVCRWKRDEWIFLPVGYGFITVLAPKGWYRTGHVCRICGARK